jgi:hypothetical protein
MEGRIWTVKDRECLDTVAKYMLKHKAAFDIPKLSNVDRDIEVSNEYVIPERVNPGGWASIDVDGDGTCLFHAFLLSTVGMMRTLPNSARSSIGWMFRTLLYQENKDKAGFKFEGRRAFSKNTEDYVSDDALMFLVNEFKVNVCLIEGRRSRGSATYDIGEYRLYIFNAAAPYIILYNKSRIHFTPVKVGDRYLFSDPLRGVETVLKNKRVPYVVYTSPGHSEEPFMVPEEEIGVPLEGLSGELNDSDIDVDVDQIINDLGGGRRRVTRKRAIRRKTRKRAMTRKRAIRRKTRNKR